MRPTRFAPILLVLAATLSAWYAVHHVPSADEGALLTGAAKILRGGVFYRDIDAYPFPGATYLLAAAMAAFGEHLSVARGLAAVVYCGITLALYAAAVTLLGRTRAPMFALALLGLKFVAWPSFTHYFYWDVALLWACLAIALLLDHWERGRRTALVGAGLAVGLAVVSKQNLGIYLGAAGLALLLFPGPLLDTPACWRTRRRDAVVFAVGAAMPIAVMVGYFASQGLLGAMAYSGLVRPFTGYLPSSGVSFVTPLRWWEMGDLQGGEAWAYFPHLLFKILRDHELGGESWYAVYWGLGEIFSRLVYASVGIAFAGVLALRIRARGRGESGSVPKTTAFAVLAFAVFFSAFPRADFGHVIGVFPLVLLLLFDLTGRVRVSGTIHWLEAATVLLFVAGTVVLSAVHYSRLTHRMTLERASVYVAPDSWVEPVVRFVSDEVPEGERLFVFGNEAHYYFLSGRFSPWPFSQLYPGQAGGDGGRELSDRLRAQPPRVVLRGMMGLPGLPAIPDYAPALTAYVVRNFEIDPRVFERYPLEGGVPDYLWWVVSVLRPCRVPPPACESFEKFVPSDSPFSSETEGSAGRR